MSPRPTNSIGNRSRSPKMPGSTSTYFGDATLPSSTTSQSGPISRRQRAGALLERPTIARVRGIDVAVRKRPHAPCSVTNVSGPRRPAFGVMMWMPGSDDGIVGSGGAANRRGVRQLAAEVQPADEAEHVAERRALLASAAARPGRNCAFGDSTCWRARAAAVAGDSRKMRLQLASATLRQNPQRSSTAPTVNPAPTDASSTRSPFFRRPLQTASFSASGIVAAVVLPNRSMLMMTLFVVDAELFGRRLDDAAVGLMRHEQIEVVRPSGRSARARGGRSPRSSARQT